MSDTEPAVSGVRGPEHSIGIPALIALFTLLFAAVVLAIGVIPVNRMLARMLNPSAVSAMWRNSLNQLAIRSFVAAAACWLTLVLSRRTGGRLTGRGMLRVGAAMSGALGGGIDVALHKLWVGQMIRAYHESRAYGNAFSLGITAMVAGLVTLFLIVRRTRVIDTR